jgi:predicted deacetylase
VSSFNFVGGTSNRDYDPKYRIESKPIRTLIAHIQERGHEIGFHGYTHQVFDESTMTRAEAEIQIREWLNIAKRKGVIPLSVCFPRNRVGHLDAFRENGFICYRGVEYVPSPTTSGSLAS